MTKKTGQYDFLWGVTQIAGQVEGNCPTNNWSAWARRGFVPVCGRGNNYWHQYRNDHQLAEDLGVNAMRVSIDWARIEPQEGVFDEHAIAHYRDIFADIQKRKMRTVVGLWHYTVPEWFETRYGLHDKSAPTHFARFVEHVQRHLGDLIDHVVVLNEPMVYIGTSYIRGERPPFFKNHYHAWRALQNLITFHQETYASWKKDYPETPIGSTHLWNDITSANDKVSEHIAVRISRWFRVGYIIKKLHKTSDFIGINYYTADKISFHGLCHIHTGIGGFQGTADWHDPYVWRDFADGFERVLTRAKTYDKPLYVLEHGKPTVAGYDDHDRQVFLANALSAMHRVIEHHTDVRGYFHYALADAYEWTSGYDFKFGLVEVNRDTLGRSKRKSFDTYKNLIKKYETLS